ncbi:MAG: hypothetical protein ACRC1H_09215 [Caldilineaceae bacterium]
MYRTLLPLLFALAGCGGGELGNAGEPAETSALATVCNFASIEDANRAMTNGVICRVYVAANE